MSLITPRYRISRFPIFLFTLVFLLVLGIIFPPIKSVRASFPGDNGKIVYSNRNNDTGSDDLFVMDSDGSNVIQLTHISDSGFQASEPAWSANGANIAFTSDQDSTPELYQTEIYIMNADGSGQVRLTNNILDDSEPAWSPDGTKIVFTVVDNNSQTVDIYSMNSDGSGRSRLTFNAEDDSHPVWSPDGTKIAFQMTTSGSARIYLMDADGTNQTPLTDDTEYAFSPNWSPDGGKIAYYGYPKGDSEASSNIYTINTNGEQKTQITNFTDGTQSFEPVWSPDGTKFAFNKANNQYFDVFVVAGDGSNLVQLTDSGGIFPDWQPLIGNQNPSVNAGGPYQVNEGGSAQVSAIGNDPENGSLTYAWDLDNNGSFETPGQSVNFLATNLDGPSSHTIVVQVTDDGNLTATDQATVNVLNVSPTVGAITAPTAPQQINTVFNASANFTDTGALDTHTAVWDWGDNTTSSGVVTESNGSGTISGSHIYTSAGVYMVSLTVTDDDLASGTNQFMYVVAYNPAGGFVTGAGRFNAPAGSIISEPLRSGMTYFGTNAKYQNNVLTGSTKLNFRDGQYVFEFDSTSYDWLVVTNGNLARLHGSGTVNGAGGYTFELTALDNSPDTIRVQIWVGTNTLVYDNNTTLLSNGNIQVHN